MGSGRRRARRALPGGTTELALGILMALGLAIAVLWGGPGDPAGPPGLGLLLGGVLVTLGLLALVLVGVARLAGRSTGRARVVRPAAPPEPLPEPIPELGWPGWRVRLGRTTHEVWIPDDIAASRLLCDGRWVEPEWHVPWSGHLEEGRFEVGGHPARLIVRFDPEGHRPDRLGATGRVEPRYELRVDGVVRPDRERVKAGWAAPPVRLDEPAIPDPPRSSGSR
jgi:hypothetical protein